MNKVNRDVVAAVILSLDKKILMGKKGPNSPGVWHDCWHLPGGGINKEENHLDALKREVLEETEVDISNAKIKLIDDKGIMSAIRFSKDLKEKQQVTMHFFVYSVIFSKKASEIDFKPGDDLEILQWFDISEIESGSIKLTPPSVELFKRIKIASLVNFEIPDRQAKSFPE